MKTKLRKGLYLVLNPAMVEYELLRKLTMVVREGIVAVQLWDNFESEDHALELSKKVIDICRSADVPVLINNRWRLAEQIRFDGIHFDTIPRDWNMLKKMWSHRLLLGITVNNDLRVAEWAVKEGFDYVSFCSMFPSDTANSCDLVAWDSVKKLTKMHDIPVFLAGGIRHDNLATLDDLDYHGIAVVSGVMNSADPASSAAKYIEQLNR